MVNSEMIVLVFAEVVHALLVLFHNFKPDFLTPLMASASSI